MKPLFAAIFAALLVIPLFPSAARADSFISAGVPMPSAQPFQVITDKEEVLAPGAAALRNLGVQITATGDSVEMRGVSGAVVTARVNTNLATVDGAKRLLPAPVTRRGGELYLPMRAIAWHLRLAYRWDPSSRTIYLHPKLTDITFMRLPDKVRVKLAGSGPLSYSASLLTQPSRIFVDIANADLFAAEQQIAVNEGDLLTVRASQNSVNPDLVRVVFDLKQEPAEYYHASVDGGRSIIVDIPAPPTPQALRNMATVSSIRLERPSDERCALIIEADGDLVTSLSSTQNPPQAVIQISNALLTAKEVSGDHPLVSSADAEQTGPHEARIVVNLRRPQPAVLVRRPHAVCVLFGSVPLSALTVVLDPGHGGRQMGAIGRSGLEEKTINLAVALEVEKLLSERGANVLLTRRDDSSLIPVASRDDLRSELTMRANLANRNKADMFVAIHCNASPHNSPPRTGTETYYCTQRSLGLARVMQRELVNRLKLRDSGVRSANFVVIRKPQMPAVLLELAYLNYAPEEALLGSPAFRRRAAEAIVAGIERFVEEGGVLEWYAETDIPGAAPSAAPGKPAAAGEAAVTPKPVPTGSAKPGEAGAAAPGSPPAGETSKPSKPAASGAGSTATGPEAKPAKPAPPVAAPRAADVTAKPPMPKAAAPAGNAK